MGKQLSVVVLMVSHSLSVYMFQNGDYLWFALFTLITGSAITITFNEVREEALKK